MTATKRALLLWPLHSLCCFVYFPHSDWQLNPLRKRPCKLFHEQKRKKIKKIKKKEHFPFPSQPECQKPRLEKQVLATGRSKILMDPWGRQGDRKASEAVRRSSTQSQDPHKEAVAVLPGRTAWLSMELALSKHEMLLLLSHNKKECQITHSLKRMHYIAFLHTH